MADHALNAPPTARGVVSPPVPHQLPPVPAGFVGRVSDRAALTAALDTPRATAAPAIAALSGASGVGKTSLALRWAHEHLDRFPDGQLYVDLRSFDAITPSLTVAEAVRGFLHALDSDALEYSDTIDTQLGLYHRLVANKRVLIILDDVRDATQVVPLLPESQSCVVLVISHMALSGLAERGAHLVDVRPLSADDARDLLAHQIGQGRLVAEPDATDELVANCAGLPAALSAASAHAVRDPAIPVSTLLRELQDVSTRVARAAGDSIVSAICGLAVQASARGWQRNVQQMSPATGPLREYSVWTLLALAPSQLDTVLGYLSGRLCRGLLEMLIVLDHSSHARSWDEAKVQLSQIFIKELADKLELTADQAGQVLRTLWYEVADSVRVQAERLRTDRVFNANNIAYLNTLTRATKPDETPQIERMILERAAIAEDRPRAQRAHSAARLIADSAQERYAKQAMPHSREDHQISIEDIYVSRTLCSIPATMMTIGIRDGGVIDVVDEQKTVVPTASALGEDVPESGLIDRRFVVVGNPGAGKRHLYPTLTLSARTGRRKRWPGRACDARTESGHPSRRLICVGDDRTVAGTHTGRVRCGHDA